MSPQVQNGIIKIISPIVSNDILEAVHGAGKSNLINDKTTNICTMERLSICLHFVDRDLKRETF